MNKTLEQLCHHAMYLEKVDEVVQCYLPDSIKAQCQVAAFNKGCLTLLIKDSVWATQLRYALPTLRDQLRTKAGLYQLTSIKISIDVSRRIIRHKKKRNTLSNGAQNTIRQFATQCSYPPLQKALRQLASNYTMNDDS